MKAKVLIIEDDRDLANLFRIVLEMSGLEVSTVNDGRKGVEMLTTRPLQITRGQCHHKARTH
jgi:DNA-binding response OmpR family regulator